MSIDYAGRQLHPYQVSSDATVQAMWGYATGDRTAITVVACAVAIAAIALVVRRVLRNRADAKIWGTQLNLNDNAAPIGRPPGGRQRG